MTETNDTQLSNRYNTIDALHRDNIQFNAGKRLVAFAIFLIRPLVLCNLRKVLHNNGCSSATSAIGRSLLHNIRWNTLHISIKRFPIASSPQWRRLDTIAHGRTRQRFYLRSRHLQQRRLVHRRRRLYIGSGLQRHTVLLILHEEMDVPDPTRCRRE